MVIFHSYVKLPEGNGTFGLWKSGSPVFVLEWVQFHLLMFVVIFYDSQSYRGYILYGYIWLYPNWWGLFPRSYNNKCQQIAVSSWFALWKLTKPQSFGVGRWSPQWRLQFFHQNSSRASCSIPICHILVGRISFFFVGDIPNIGGLHVSLTVNPQLCCLEPTHPPGSSALQLPRTARGGHFYG